MAEVIQTVDKTPVAAPGSTGLGTQLPGQATTVDGIDRKSGSAGMPQPQQVALDLANLWR